jgi:hypothetical protein
MTSNASLVNFMNFYRNVFLNEHRHWGTIILHVLGTWAGLAWIVLCVYNSHYWLLLLFPVIHAVPGLIGHRLFERNEDVGDLRVTRQDFSPLWFIVANHLMSIEIIFKGVYWRNKKAA